MDILIAHDWNDLLGPYTEDPGDDGCRPDRPRARDLSASVAAIGRHRLGASGCGSGRAIAVYTHLVDLLVYPDEALLESVRSGRLAASIRRLRPCLPYALAPGAFDAVPGDGEPALGPDYIRLFDVPVQRHAVPSLRGSARGRSTGRRWRTCCASTVTSA